MQSDAKPLYIMIKRFVEKFGISWGRYEIVTSMDPATLRGSYLPHPPGELTLNRLPEAKDEALSEDILSLVPHLIDDNSRIISESIYQDTAATYLMDAYTYLKTLSLSNQALLQYTLQESDVYNTGICGETANKLERISKGSKLMDTSLDGLINMMRSSDRPRIYAVVQIGPSHSFYVEKVVDKIFLLQSWVGRFSLASWISKGTVEWDLDMFLMALKVALPDNQYDDINQYYSLLFNLNDADPTPSAHTAGQVSCTIYQSADNEKVSKSIEATYRVDDSNWS